MAKQYSKEEKLQMLEKVKNFGCTTAAKILNINKSTVISWKKELRVLGKQVLNQVMPTKRKELKEKDDQNL